MKITKSMFIAAYNAGIVDAQDIDKTNLTDEDIGIVYTVIDEQECFLIINKIFDSFSKRDIFIQLVANMSGNISSDISSANIDHLKSRKLIYVASGKTHKWSRWYIEDSDMLNYLSRCLDSGSNIKMRHWNSATV